MSDLSPTRSNRADIERLLDSYVRHLRASNYSPKTVSTYSDSINPFIAFLQESGMPLLVSKLDREHVEGFVSLQLEKYAPATASVRYRALQSFFNFLVEERLLEETPMRNMRPPRIPEEAVPVLTVEQQNDLPP